jgi:hypothetical protein
MKVIRAYAGPERYRPRYRVIHEDSLYHNQSGRELYKDEYGLIHLRLDSGEEALFCPRELQRRKAPTYDWGRGVNMTRSVLS